MQDVPGVTRDRIAYDALWNGRRFTLVDTGGWEPDARGLQARVSAQAERAVATADLVLFVVDGRTGRHRDRPGRRPHAAPGQAAGRARRHQGRRRARRVRRRRAVVARPGRAVPGQRPARPRQRRPARRDPRRAAGRADRSETPRAARAGSPWSAGPTSASPACSTGSPARSARWSTRSPARPIDPVDSLVATRRRGVALRRHRRPAPSGQAGQRDGVLRQPAHGRGHRGGRGRGRAARRVRADQRAGPARHRRPSSRPAGRW